MIAGSIPCLPSARPAPVALDKFFLPHGNAGTGRAE